MDRSLATLLRSLQTSSTYEDAARLLPTATSLLSILTNPLNVTLLASQLLSNSILYPRPLELESCQTILGLFYAATSHHVNNELNDKAKILKRLSRDEWAKALIQGADSSSPRWRHLLLLSGVLLGSERQPHEGLSSALRAKVELALVIATNLALEEAHREQAEGSASVVFVLNNSFPLLSDSHRAKLNYDLLLPLAVETTFFSKAGLEHGYWLQLIDSDVIQSSGQKFTWSVSSPAFKILQTMKSKVLISSLGPLSRLLAHAVENVRDLGLIIKTMERLTDFARTLAVSWRRVKLSEIDPAEEDIFLEAEALQHTIPVLWQTLRSIMFAIVIILRAVLGRMLCDPVLGSEANAPLVSQQSLHILRNLYFIVARFGQTSVSQYAFVNFSAIDILNQFPGHAEGFLRDIAPSERSQISSHPLDRNLDLFFLNTAEHFTLRLNPQVNDHLLLECAAPYLEAGHNPQVTELYEAAHSLALAVLAAAHGTSLAAHRLPTYMDTLMTMFPASLSPRQFRLAIKSVMKLAAPPSKIAQAQPLLQVTILELLRERATSASADLLHTDGIKRDAAAAAASPTSEKASNIMSILDSLPFLTIPVLEEWLPIAASLVNSLTDSHQYSTCQQRFWEVLNNGDMDPERAATCVIWWNSRGGREMLLYNELPEDDPSYLMSGVLQHAGKL